MKLCPEPHFITYYDQLQSAKFSLFIHYFILIPPIKEKLFEIIQTTSIKVIKLMYTNSQVIRYKMLE